MRTITYGQTIFILKESRSQEPIETKSLPNESHVYTRHDLVHTHTVHVPNEDKYTRIRSITCDLPVIMVAEE